jgi:hypothetical protein
MRRKLIALIVILAAAGCSVRSPQAVNEAASADTGSGPKLVLSAYPRQGFAPMTVSFNATLEGVSEDDKEYYCLKEEWEFGDGAVSSEQPNCVTDGSSPTKLNFFVEHTYIEKGSYTIWLILGDKKIRSNQIGISVLESDIQRN